MSCRLTACALAGLFSLIACEARAIDVGHEVEVGFICRTAEPIDTMIDVFAKDGVDAANATLQVFIAVNECVGLPAPVVRPVKQVGKDHAVIRHQNKNVKATAVEVGGAWTVAFEVFPEA